MQENLDVLISFVIVIIGLSILVQIVVEMIKNLLKIRWDVYERFLKDIYNRYFFDSPQSLEDSTRPAADGLGRIRNGFLKIKSREKIGSIIQRFQNLYDKVVAFAADLKELKDTLGRLRKNLDSQHYQFDPDSLRKLLNELDLLRLRLQGKKFSQLFEIYLRGVDQETTATFNNLLENLNRIVGTDVGHIVVQELCDAIDRLFEMLHVIECFVVDYRNKIADNIESWRQDLENRYSRSIAKVSFVVGCVVVILLNGDAVMIYRSLRDSPTVTQNLIERSDAFTNVVQSSVSPEDLDRLNALAQKINSALEPDEEIPAEDYRAFVDRYRTAASSLIRAAEAHNDLYGEGGDAGRMLIRLPHSREDMLQEPFPRSQSLLAEKRVLEPGDVAAVNAEIDRAVEHLVGNYVAFQYRAMLSRNELIHSTGLPLGWNGRRLAAAFGDPVSLLVKLVGLLLTTVLISFGAPFWNDVLKSLFGIRSLLKKREAAMTGSQ